MSTCFLSTGNLQSKWSPRSENESQRHAVDDFDAHGSMLVSAQSVLSPKGSMEANMINYIQKCICSDHHHQNLGHFFRHEAIASRLEAIATRSAKQKEQPSQVQPSTIATVEAPRDSRTAETPGRPGRPGGRRRWSSGKRSTSATVAGAVAVGRSLSVPKGRRPFSWRGVQGLPSSKGGNKHE